MQRHTFNPLVCKFKKIISLWICAAIILCGLITPETASSLSIKEEDELSKEFLKAVFQELEVIQDPVIDDYINKIGQKIVSGMPEQPFPYKFYAVRQDAYNAFAGPGGHIFIFPDCLSRWIMKTSWLPSCPTKSPMCRAAIFQT